MNDDFLSIMIYCISLFSSIASHFTADQTSYIYAFVLTYRNTFPLFTLRAETIFNTELFSKLHVSTVT